LAHLQYPWRFLSLAAVGVMGLEAAVPALVIGGVWPGAAHLPLGQSPKSTRRRTPGGFSGFAGDTPGAAAALGSRAASAHHCGRSMGGGSHVAGRRRGRAGGRYVDGRVLATHSKRAALGVGPDQRRRGRWACAGSPPIDAHRGADTMPSSLSLSAFPLTVRLLSSTFLRGAALERQYGLPAENWDGDV
jgi:hypothetical protein